MSSGETSAYDDQLHLAVKMRAKARWMTSDDGGGGASMFYRRRALIDLSAGCQPEAGTTPGYVSCHRRFMDT